MKNKNYIVPEWPAPQHVHAVVTTRQHGNLATHVNDNPATVLANREKLRQDLALPEEPLWLEQVHGVAVMNLDYPVTHRTADASYAATPGKVCAVLTADCLPVLLTNQAGTEVSAVHAGWKGLLAGVIDAAATTFKAPADQLLVWLGPAIGPDHFEVGEEVRQQYIARHPDYAAGFKLGNNGRWFGDLYLLAIINLRHLGITAVYGGGLCTYCDATRFYSFRRDANHSGRMASLIWMEGMASLIWRK